MELSESVAESLDIMQELAFYDDDDIEEQEVSLETNFAVRELIYEHGGFQHYIADLGEEMLNQPATQAMINKLG